jgi:hypothetical protein
MTAGKSWSVEVASRLCTLYLKVSDNTRLVQGLLLLNAKADSEGKVEKIEANIVPERWRDNDEYVQYLQLELGLMRLFCSLG